MSNQLQKIEAIASAILKAVIILCVCFIACYSLESCELNSNIIADCNEACDTVSGQMESVTSYECICASKQRKQSPWVIN